ncbi:cucumber peeling cupredoxin-like [Prunus avium]|uniref:Cucumber peeling cupredoxin-like n=1 Tax=Prunus avium TaxID=42229 RepID=A0A6P5U293_PRUAV|nr:cucumber peeling cupredoxin-like [Prunus avium]
MESKMVVVFGVFVAVFVQCVAAQTVHVVGDSLGWTIPRSGQQYVTWASANKFVVGDILIFNFATNAHDVQQVPKASFDSCSSDNAIGSSITTGPANVSLTSAGDNYFICTYGTHCQSGQKLAITVSAAAPGASPSAPTSAPPPPPATTTPTTPSPSSNDPAACAPVPSPSPSPSTAGGPTVKAIPESSPAPDNSSSPAVVAGFTLSFLSLVIMGLFF